MIDRQIYLGDGAFAKVDDYGDVVVYTSDGLSITNSVVLERRILEVFVEWLKIVGNE